MSKNTLSYEEVLKYIAFLASSARGVIREPPSYGSFRLVDAVSRFIELLKTTPEYRNNEFLLKLEEYIDKEKYKVMYDLDDYLKFLENLVKMIAEESMKH